MIAAFGNYLLTHLKVWTDRIDDSLPEDKLLEALQSRPAAEALVLAQSSGRLRL